MANESLFRTSLSGFNKQDVTNYIEELNVRYNKQTQELENEIKSLNKELDKMPSLLEAKEKYDKLKEEKESLAKEKKDLEEAMKEMAKTLEEKEQLLDEALEENASLSKRVRSGEKEGFAAPKAAASSITVDDSLSEEFEEILGEARREAQSVIAQAQSLAEEIVNNAKEKARLHTEEARAKAEEVVRQSDEAVRDNLKRVKYLNRKKDELSGIFKSHKDQMDSFFTSVSQSLKGE